MKKICLVALLITLFVGACSPSISPADNNQETPPASIDAQLASDLTKTIIVTSTADSGSGTLRQAMYEAHSGDIIRFDTTVFPPDQPASILLSSSLPVLKYDGVTLDASQAGVIIDGSQISGEWVVGLEITSQNNVIMGLEIINFSGAGILLQENAKGNIIGGDSTSGNGPNGQGNMILNTSDGIGLLGSNNQVIGNFIGIDPTGTMINGCSGPGIFLEGAASRNIIGPGNVIAFNGVVGGAGIEIRTSSGVGNRVTQNNLHDNQGGALVNQLGEDGNAARLQAPQLLDIDMAQGNVSGLSCPGCTVELFTSNSEGDIFEGEITADENGYFNFEKSVAFIGDQLKANAFIDGQNTSEFSAPLNIAKRNLVLQSDNSYPRQALSDVPYDELAFNHIGTMQYIGCDDVRWADDYARQMEQMDFTWARVTTEWYDWPEVLQSGEYSELSVDPCQDRAIEIMAEKNIPMLYTIVYWDPEITVTDGYSRFQDQQEIDRYLDFVRFIVEHFKGKIQWYSILNEPNLMDGQRAVKVQDYINLARQVIPVIKEIDPDARVVIAETTPLNEVGGLEYLNTILASDVLPLADGIAWHGSSGNSLEYQPDFYRNYPGWVDQIVSTAQNNGFKGQFFATELHWRTADTPQPIDGMPWFYSNVVSGKYYARGMLTNLAKGFWITVGHEGYESIPEAVNAVTSLTGLLAGEEPVDVIVSTDPVQKTLSSAAFSLPDGSRLVAVWRDEIAVDDDPGVEVTLNFPDEQAQTVTAIDPIYAYQQELEFQSENGVRIPGFMLYDYPIIIRLQ